jgi:cell division protein FtsQ
VAGKSLLRVNASALAAKLDALPDVRSVRVDRAFPHTVAVTVVMERAAAFVRDGKVRYVVSADGRVLRTVTRVPVLLPRLLLPIGPVPAAGRTIDTAQMQAALQVLAGVPRGFQRDIARLRGVVANQSGVVAVFGHGLHIRLGDTSALPLKLRIAARVLGKMGTSIQQSVSIVDVSAPARPAVTYKK